MSLYATPHSIREHTRASEANNDATCGEAPVVRMALVACVYCGTHTSSAKRVLCVVYDKRTHKTDKLGNGNVLFYIYARHCKECRAVVVSRVVMCSAYQKDAQRQTHTPTQNEHTTHPAEPPNPAY